MSIKKILDTASANTNSLFSQLDWDDEFIRDVLSKKASNGLRTFSEYRLKQWYEDSVLNAMDIEYNKLVYTLNASRTESHPSAHIAGDVDRLLSDRIFCNKFMTVKISPLNEYQIERYIITNYTDKHAMSFHHYEQVCLILQKERCFYKDSTQTTTIINKKDDNMNNLKDVNVSYAGSKISQHTFYGNDDISAYNTDGLLAVIVMLKGKLKTLKKMKIKSAATDTYKKNIKNDIAFVTNMLDNNQG